MAGADSKVTFLMPTRAILRGVPDTFDRAISSKTPRPAIDVKRARIQHQAIVEQLDMYGVDMIHVPSDPALPDCPFVEDCCVSVGGTLLVTASAVESRRGEAAGVAAAAGAGALRVERMEPPAALDGGDVLTIGDVLYVGLSSRTNEAGVAALERLAAREGKRVVRVKLRDGVLHLKSAVTAARPGLLLAVKGAFDAAPFGGAEICWVEERDRLGVNVLPIGSWIFVTSSAPRVEDELRHRGCSTVQCEITEFEKADGGLSCLVVPLA